MENSRRLISELWGLIFGMLSLVIGPIRLILYNYFCRRFMMMMRLVRDNIFFNSNFQLLLPNSPLHLYLIFVMLTNGITEQSAKFHIPNFHNCKVLSYAFQPSFDTMTPGLC